jgi:hypothetical protein
MKGEDASDQVSGVRGQRSEVRGQRSEVSKPSHPKVLLTSDLRLAFILSNGSLETVR